MGCVNTGYPNGVSNGSIAKIGESGLAVNSI